MSKLDKTFLVVILIQVILLIGVEFFIAIELIKMISFVVIVLTMIAWYFLNKEEKKL
jgi:hypothetical protein